MPRPKYASGTAPRMIGIFSCSERLDLRAEGLVRSHPVRHRNTQATKAPSRKAVVLPAFLQIDPARAQKAQERA